MMSSGSPVTSSRKITYEILSEDGPSSSVLKLPAGTQILQVSEAETGKTYYLVPTPTPATGETAEVDGISYELMMRHSTDSTKASEVQPERTQKPADQQEVASIDKPATQASRLLPVLPDLIQMKQVGRTRSEAIAGTGAPRQYHHPQNPPKIDNTDDEAKSNKPLKRRSMRIANILSKRVDVKTPESIPAKKMKTVPVLMEKAVTNHDNSSLSINQAVTEAPRQYHGPRNYTSSNAVGDGSRSAHATIGEVTPTAILYEKPPVTKERMEEAKSEKLSKPSMRIANAKMISNRVDVDTPENTPGKNMKTVPMETAVPNQTQLEYPIINNNLSEESNFGIMAEDFVSLSDSDEDIEGGPARKCVVCLRKSRFMEDIFVKAPEIRVVPGMGPPRRPTDPPRLLKDKELLISYLHIPKPQGKPNELGVCVTCLDHLERFHVFNCAVLKRHEDAKDTPPGYFHSTPLDIEPLEQKVYRNLKQISVVKQIYKSGTHSHFARRHLTDRDWDFFCEQLIRITSPNSNETLALEGYINCREKLSQLYCVECHRMVRNGKKGFKKHVEAIHPNRPVLFPCDICGKLFPEKGIESTANNVGYFTHWISHFYLNKCKYCDKTYVSRQALSRHTSWVHRSRGRATKLKSAKAVTKNLPPGPTKPRKSAEKDVTLKLPAAIPSTSKSDSIHPNPKKHKHECIYCGMTYRTGAALLAHERERHKSQPPAYQCEICIKIKMFHTTEALRRHKREIHNAVKRFACDGCEMRFSKKSRLAEHVTKHTGELPFGCTLCGMKVRAKSFLRRHMKTHETDGELATTRDVGRNLILELDESNQSHPENTDGVAGSACSSSSGGGKSERNPKKLWVGGRTLEIRQEVAAATGTAPVQSQQQALNDLSNVAIQYNPPCLALVTSASSSITGDTTGGSVGALGNAELKTKGMKSPSLEM